MTLSGSTLEDNWVCFEEHIENRISDAEVYASEEDYGFKEEHADRPCECYGKQLLQSLFLKLNGCVYVAIASGLA